MAEIGDEISRLSIPGDKGIDCGSSAGNRKIFVRYLNDDCLHYIFQYLPVADRVRIERVCKRWQRLSKESWYSRKSLDPYRETCGSNPCDDVLLKCPRGLHEVLKRCGRYLRSLKFIGYTDELKEVGRHVGPLCPNLRHLELSGATRLALRNVAENCRDIRSLYLRDTCEPCADELSLLFARNANLELLELVCECQTSDGKFWLDLPARSIRTLNVLNSDASTRHFNKVVREMKNLSKLSLDYWDQLDDESFEAICSVASLREIQTGYCLENITSLNPMLNLEHLRVLELSWSEHVDDEFLSNLRERCRELVDVDISGCIRVSDAGVASLTLLPKLERLILNFLGITARAFHAMPRLRVMECFECSRISTKCFSRIIEAAESLELLNVCYCGVFNSTVYRAIAATRRRRNNVTLRMYAQGTRIRLDSIRSGSPRLKVIFGYRLHRAKDYI